MSYSSITQLEDHISDTQYFDRQSSPSNHNSLQSTSRTMSPNLELQSNHFETLTRPRTVSRHGSGAMRHPTPDLQSLQGAYLSNIERLEESAERLSMSSDIGEEIKKMREEQKRSDSRRSSSLNPNPEEGLGSRTFHRQLSYGYGSHASNSIVGTNSVARSGGFSPAPYFASPRSSVRSGSWSHHNSLNGRSASQGPRLTQVTEPEQEGKPLDSPMSTRAAPLGGSPNLPGHALRVTNDDQHTLDNIIIPETDSLEPQTDGNQPGIAEYAQEPRSSTDTARQRNSLFLDFDGVHTIAQPSETPPEEEFKKRRCSTRFLDGRPQSFPDPQPGEGIVYYPAPVPMMLNLPKRLSKLPANAQRDKRRSAVLGNLPVEARKSAAWLSDMPKGLEEQHHSADVDWSSHPEAHKRRTLTDLPSQLRASMFFDYPATGRDVEVKGESAVATLDSILDASAFAPVSAFTDHPVAGHVGAEVYGHALGKPRASPEIPDTRRRSSTVDLLTKRDSNSNLLEETKKRSSLMSVGTYFVNRKSSGPQTDGFAQKPDNEAAPSIRDDIESNDYNLPQEDVDEAPKDEDESKSFEMQPTTLLAELQMRKQEQKLRNRTAATAFPNGMHSTLLQLDAVAQIQKQARKQRHTTLAWEDPEAHHPGAENEDDEDVPLGMLYPSQQLRNRRDEDNRPIGLIVQRQMEDNEPLSHRRARLRGEDPSLRKPNLVQHKIVYSQELPNLATKNKTEDAEDEDHLGETLAQRIKRIKATQIPTRPRVVSVDLASEIMSQFGGLPSSEQPPPPESTGSNRPTTTAPDLEEETLGQRRKRLQAEAVAKSPDVSGESNEAAAALRPALPQRRSMADLLQAHPAAGAGVRSISDELKFAPAPKMRNTAWTMQVNQQAGHTNASVLNRSEQVNGGGYAPHPMIAGHHRQQKPVEAELRQRDMIDRWRQSILY